MKKKFLGLLGLSLVSATLFAQEKGTINNLSSPKVVITQEPQQKPNLVVKPAKEDVIYGDSEFRVWNLDSPDSKVTFGIWESTPGKWKYRSNNWEYCRILSGKAIITEDGGKSFTVKAGDSFLLKANVSCTWEVLETIRKDFVSYEVGF